MLPLSFVGAPLEITKRRWRATMQALYDNHFDPRKDEELKQSKIDIENKFPQILKLVKDRRPNRRNRNAEVNLRKESELIELIEDFHKQYQFVYGLYDHLKGQLTKTVVKDSVKEEESYFTASSSSDSESEKDASSEDSHLTQERESPNSEKIEAMRRAQEREESLQKLEEESREWKKKLTELHKRRQKEASALIKAFESQIASLNLEVDALCTDKKVSADREENESLQAQFSNLEKIAKELDNELSANVVDDIGNGSESEVSELKGLLEQVSNLKRKIGLLKFQKSNADLHENLSDQVNKMKRDLGSMRKKNSELESRIKKKSRENSDLLLQIDNLKKEVMSRNLDIEKMQKDKDDILLRENNQDVEIVELDKQMATVAQENNKLKQDIEELQGKMIKMDKTLKDRENQFSGLQKGLENDEEDKSAQIVALTTQIHQLRQELELKTELEGKIQIKDQNNTKLSQEKESLQGRIAELEKMVEERGDEFSDLQNAMSTQIIALTRDVSQLQQEKDMKRKLDDQITSQEREISQLGEETESLQAKILELEIALTEKEDEVASLQKRLQVMEHETSAKFSNLSGKISQLQKELSVGKQQSEERSSQLENQKVLIKQQEDTIIKLREDCKLVKGRFLQAADRKMDEVAAEFRKNFEDNLRLLSQRIRVAEQLHTENKENWKKVQERCEQEHPGLQKKVNDIMQLGKSELLKMSTEIDAMMEGMENVLSSFESKEGSFMERLSKVSDDVQVAKNWVRVTMDETKPGNNENASSLFAPGNGRENDKLMMEKVKKLEARVSKEKGDKLRLMRGTYELQKKTADLEKTVAEKDEEMLRLGREKIEAIRQLCMWIDYHQIRFKEMALVKKTKRGGKA